ncbi:MAG TPA: DUF998 domain-containing protein [Gammaproteobacteria bacterium]|nr:DUF998 domain-containing protein [Gammaproteobacteria bacterium]
MKSPIPAQYIPAIAGVVAVAGLEFFLVVAVTLQYLRPDQDWVTTPLSFYLIGPHSGWLIAAYFALALSIFLVGWGFHMDLLPPLRSRAILALFGIAASGVCTVAVAHTDLPGAGHLTPEGMLHNTAAIVAFAAAGIGMLLQAWWLRYDSRWRDRHRIAFLLAVLAFAALWTYVLLPWLPRGATQKFVILLIVLWLLMAARWLTLTWTRELET